MHPTKLPGPVGLSLLNSKISARKNNLCIIMILNFPTDRSGQTVQTKITLFLKEQSDQSLHCLPFYLHFWRYYAVAKPHFSNFRITIAIFSGVLIFLILTVTYCPMVPQINCFRIPASLITHSLTFDHNVFFPLILSRSSHVCSWSTWTKTPDHV